LEEFEAKKKYCKIMITQPRRIAVVNLKRRLQEQLGDKIGMRMGHGVREESENCKIFFVTTGYLVKLLAYRPEFLSAVTHIIIDEVHERSLDSDLLCWLARQHLSSSNDTRLVLMSATLHTSLYARYFHNNVIMKREPTSLSVGVRRFPVDIHFVEDILLLNDIPKGMKTSLELIKKQCEPPNGSSGLVVPSRLAKIQYDVALALIRVKGKVGSTVLVFVSGITDIVEIQSRFDGLDKYELVAIHSDIPFEEQELALMPPAPDKIKVIVATNAAESSVTLPNLDVVICLGTHKAINFKTGDILRSNLENVWISKSSAIQRAGRTGRIRPGTVYRLYTRELYDSFVDFEEAEIHRKPLHEIILSLKATFQDSHGHSGVIPILSDMLETPDLSKVDECLEYLHEGKMITAPTDMARLTSRGEFAGHLPLDIGLANMVMYGINLGVGPESIVAAAALAQPKSPFRVAHPLVHNDPMEYNEIVRQTFMGALYFDGGMYSDPFMMIRMMVEWLEVDASHQFRFCTHHGLVLTRMKHFVSFANHLFRQVKQLMKGAIDVVGDARRIVSKYADQSEEDDFSFGNIEKHISDSKLNRLRLAMLWAFDHNLIYSRGGKAANTDIDSAINELVVLPSSTLKRNIIEELFPSHLIPQRIDICGKKIYSIPPPFDSVDKIGDGLKELLKHLFVHEDVFFVSSSYSMILPGDANIKEDISLTNQKKKKKKCGSNLRKTSILFAVRNIDRRRQQFINLINKRISPFTTTLVGNIDSSNVAERIPSISIYELKDVDEHVYLDFTSALMHVGGISLHVVSDGTANLLSNDVGISVDTIRSLYPPKLAAVLEEELVNAAVPIKTSDVYERISFLEKSESKHCANESGKQKGGNKKQSGKRENLSSKLNTAEESEVPGRRKLCDDLSLGMRLFNAYCMGQRQKKMMYRQLPETDSTTDAKDEKEIVRPRKVVIGSAQWRAQKSAAKAMTEAAKPTENVEQSSAPMPKPVYEVEQYSRKPVLSAWKIMSGKWVSDKKNDADNNDEVVNVSSVPLSRFFAVGKWDDVVMSTRSVVSTSCHGPFPHQPPPCPVLFGVAYSAVTLGSNVVEKLNNVIVEGVTIFPVGSDWIDRALFCMGKCLNQDFEMNLDNNPSVGCMSHHQMCRFIQRLVSMGMDHSIDYDGMLIHAVDLLFADYLTPSDHEWTAEDAERVSNHFRKLVRNFNEKKFLTNADTRQVSKHSTSVANHQSRIAIIAEKRTAFQRAKVAQSESSNVIANVVKKKINNSKRDKSKKTKKENPIFQPQGGTLSKKGKKEKASEKKNKPK
jgi:HrpA-like RNA helicase